MPGKRSVSLEPENIAAASPRRSSRIKINHQDSPVPVVKSTEQELPVRRTRRSLSIQEKSLNDIKDDLKKSQETAANDEKPKTPARRTRRSSSAQEQPKQVLMVKLEKSTVDASKEVKDDKITEEKIPEKEEEVEEENTLPKDEENPGGRPKRRVTRSMSKSPVSLKNAKLPVAAPVSRSKRLSLNDKQVNELKVPALDIITENESEHEKIEETNETDVLNNNKKQTEISEKETTNVSEENQLENVIEPSEIINNKDETDTTLPDNLKKLNTSVNTPSPRRSPRVKAKESPISNKTEEDNEEKLNLNVSQKQIEIIEKKVNELIEMEEQVNETDTNTKEKEETEEIKVSQETEEIFNDEDKLNKSNISIVGNTSINSNLKDSILKGKETISKELIEEDERPQNISLVNDDGRSYSPIILKTDQSLQLNESKKSLNSTSTPQKTRISPRNTSQTMEALHISVKDEDDEKIINETFNVKDISPNLDSSKNTSKSTPNKNVNDSLVSSVKSLESGKKIKNSTPIKTPDGKENNDNNSSKKKSSSKRASVNQLREQILDDYIATFTAEKKRKRESLDSSELESDSNEKNKKRRSGEMTKVGRCDFSDDEEPDKEQTNEFIDDTVSVGSEDTPSIGSNDIIDDGEYIESSSSIADSNDTYENDSFVVDDDEVEDEELLSGTEDFLGNIRKRKRILKMDSDSEEEKDKLDKMSMEAYGGMSPSDMSEKQISSIDSDLESIKNRNEELSKQIEDGTLIPEVEATRKIDDSESDDDDIMIIEENPKELENSSNEIEENEDKSLKGEDISENVPVETVEDIQKDVVEDIQKEVVEDIQKEEVEDIQKEEVEDIQKEEVEDIQKEAVEDIQKEAVEDIQKEAVEDIQEENDSDNSIFETKSSNTTKEKLNISTNSTTSETKKLEIINNSEDDEEEEEEETVTKQTEHENEEDRETKYKKLIEKYFNVTNKNRSRRQTLEGEIRQTPIKPSRKRNTSLGIELSETTQQTNEKPQIIEVNIDLKQTENVSDVKYEFNNSGIYEVSQIETEKPSKTDTQCENNESLLMLQDFNDSLNDSLDLITSCKSKNKSFTSEKDTSLRTIDSPNIEKSSKKKQKQNKTPVKSSDDSENMNTGSGKKKRKKNQLDTSVNEEIAVSPVNYVNMEDIEESAGKKKKKRSKSKEKTETTTESDTTMIEEPDLDEIKCSVEQSENQMSRKKKRKIKMRENNTTEPQNETNKKKKLNKKKSVSSESDDTLFHLSTDSEKDNSMESNKHRKKNKLTQCLFNFKVKNEKLSPSKSEIDEEDYVPPKHRNIYKNLIKPSTSGFSGSSQFIIKDLVSKVSYGIKKQKHVHTKVNKTRITELINSGNWKETLLADDIVKNVQVSKASTSRKHKKSS